MRFDRTMTLRCVAPLQRCGLWKTSPGVPILMYHSVSEDPERGVSAYYRLAVAPKVFREHMQVIKSGGFSVVSLEHAAAALRNADADLKKMVVVTFDDGFRDFQTQAWPILQQFEFSATVFLPTNYIQDERRRFLNRECLVWSEVRELHKAGIQFGSHTVSHPKLVTLSEEDLEEELFRSRRIIEDQIGSRVDSFAHPYAFPQDNASYVECFRRHARSAGYRLCVTTIVGRAKPDDDLLTLKRIPVNGADGPEFLAAKLAGAYDWVGFPQLWFKRLRGLRQRNAIT